MVVHPEAGIPPAGLPAAAAVVLEALALPARRMDRLSLATAAQAVYLLLRGSQWATLQAVAEVPRTLMEIPLQDWVVYPTAKRSVDRELTAAKEVTA